MSKIRIVKGKSLNIPIKLENKFDITGQEDLIRKFSDDVLQDIINPIKDYEVSKFIHDYDENGENGLYIAASFIDRSGDTSFWIDEYYPQGFEQRDLVLFSDDVKNSFFKLDFFDSPNREKQKLQLTKIIPIYLSNLSIYDADYDGVADYEDEMVDIDGDGIDDNTAGNDDFGDRFEGSSNLTRIDVGTYIVPNIYSDKLKNNEVSDLFVFKDLDTKSFNEFYVSCRFFNAKTGNVVRMTNTPLLDSGINPLKDFYYKVKLDRQKLTYEFYEYIDGVEGDRVGDSEDNPLLFYQML